MTDEQIINKFRKILRGYLETDDLTPEEIEEIINRALSEQDIIKRIKEYNK